MPISKHGTPFKRRALDPLKERDGRCDISRGRRVAALVVSFWRHPAVVTAGAVVQSRPTLSQGGGCMAWNRLGDGLCSVCDKNLRVTASGATCMARSAGEARGLLVRVPMLRCTGPAHFLDPSPSLFLIFMKL